MYINIYCKLAMIVTIAMCLIIGDSKILRWKPVTQGYTDWYIKMDADNNLVFISPDNGASKFYGLTSFRVIPALNGRDGYISFESIDSPTNYIRHSGYRLKVHPYENSELYKNDASWNQTDAFDGDKHHVSYQSSNYPNRYWIHANSEILILPNDGSPIFDSAASWNIAISFDQPPMYCEWGNWINSFDNGADVKYDSAYIAGMASEHDNHRDDRIFKFKSCRPDEGFSPFSGIESTIPYPGDSAEFDECWTKSCASFNAGQSALNGFHSWHHNGYEDRVFAFDCAHLDDQYRFVDCFWTGYENDLDQSLNYECPSNGFIRSIYSCHDDGPEDRQFAFECCYFGELLPSFYNIFGQWEIKGCIGCPTTEREISWGIESSKFQNNQYELTTEYTNSITSSIKSSMEFLFNGGTGGGESSITTTMSESTRKTISSSMGTSLNKQLQIKETIPCDKNFFYQWKVGADESWNGDINSVYIWSDIYLCTDVPNPQCPPQFCDDKATCQTCIPFN